MSKPSSPELMKEIPLPELGEGVTSGEFVKWLVNKGDKIHTDQILAEVMTDKAAMEVSSPYDGVVEDLLAQEGETVEVGHTLLILKISDNTTNKVKENEVEPASTDVSHSQNVQMSLPQEQMTKKSHLYQDNVLATPFTRRLAQQLGIDLKVVKGSGLAGRITKEDMERHSSLKIQKTSSILSSDFSNKTSLSYPVTAGIQGFSIPQEEGQQRTPLKGVRKKNR